MAGGAWYIGEGGQKSGPFGRDDVDGFVRAGRIRPETLVWSEGMANWVRADSAGLIAGPPRIPRAPHVVGGAVAQPDASVGVALRRFFANYGTFTGRASRAEFWWPTLVLFAVMGVAATVDFNARASGSPAFVSVFVFFATLVPSLAVTVRRLHDTDKSAWFVLLAAIPIGQFVLLVLCAMPGTAGPNRFGDTA